MNRTYIPVEESLARWRKDLELMKEYDALELPFAFYGARVHADISRAELAERMGTSQSAIARLESGRIKPPTRTLEKLAAATGMRLRIVLSAA